MPQHNGKNMADTKDTADTIQNASLDYIAALVCDPTEVGDLVQVAREHVSIDQIDIALAWYQKAERLLPHLQSSSVSAREELLQQMMECYPGE